MKLHNYLIHMLFRTSLGLTFDGTSSSYRQRFYDLPKPFHGHLVVHSKKGVSVYTTSDGTKALGSLWEAFGYILYLRKVKKAKLAQKQE